MLRKVWKYWKQKQVVAVQQKVAREMELAISDTQAEEYSTATTRLLKAIEFHDYLGQDTRDWILGWLAFIWQETEQYSLASEFFQIYASRHPEEMVAAESLACSLWYGGNLQEAAFTYTRILTMEPNRLWALSGRGQVYVELREYELALTDLNLALNLTGHADGDSLKVVKEAVAYTLNGKAAALAGLMQFEQALSEFDRSVTLCPDNAWVYFNRAIAFESMGKLADARLDFVTALEKTKPKLTPLKRKYAMEKTKA